MTLASPQPTTAQVEAEYNYLPGSLSGPLTPSDAERLRQAQQQLQLQDAIRWQQGLPSVAPGLRPPWAAATPPEDFYYYNPRWLYGWRSYTDSAPQSIGQRQVQTGPNRWESFPVYAASPLAPPKPLIVAPHEAAPPLEPPPQLAPEASPPEPLPPPKPQRQGPREF
jgi:hypothetical protein